MNSGPSRSPQPHIATAITHLCAGALMLAWLTGSPIIAWPLLAAALCADVWGYRLRARHNARTVEALINPPPRHLTICRREGPRQ
jgi:hypothetical protein